MTNKKPKDIDEYKKWLKEKHKIEISDKTQKNYDSVTSRIKIDFEKSDYWIQLTENLREYNGDYPQSQTKFQSKSQTFFHS